MDELPPAAGTPKPARGQTDRPDLRDEVTAFVMTVGAPTYDACLAHLKRQDCLFHLEIVDHVAPLSAAYQAMLDRCQTPFFIQVDEDMLLRPHAVRTLHERMRDAAPNVVEIVGALFDVHEDRAIEGLKIFRHDVIRNYPLGGCDMHQFRRLIADRFEIVKLRDGDGLTPTSPEILGLHGTSYTTRSVYERYLTLAVKRRRAIINSRHGVERAHRFLDRFLEDPSELSYFALMSIISGMITNIDDPYQEKDFRLYDHLPGYDEAQKLWRNCRRASPYSSSDEGEHDGVSRR